MSEEDVVDPVGVCLNLLAEGRGFGLLGHLCRIIFLGCEWVLVIVVGFQVDAEIPGAY